MAIDERDYRDRSHEWLDRLLRRKTVVVPQELPPQEEKSVVEEPTPRRVPRRPRARRWLIPLAVVVNCSAILWTILSVLGLDYVVAVFTSWLKSMPRDWWLGSAVVAGVWVAPRVLRAIRRRH